MYTKEPHIIYKRLKTISLTVSTVILSLVQKYLQMVSFSIFRWQECLYSHTWSISIQFTFSGPTFITSFLTLSSHNVQVSQMVFSLKHFKQKFFILSYHSHPPRDKH